MLLEKEQTLTLSQFPYMNKIHSTAIKIEEIKKKLTPIYQKEEKNFIVSFMIILLLSFCGITYISLKILTFFFNPTSLDLLFLTALPIAMFLTFLLQQYFFTLLEKNEDKLVKFFNKKSSTIQKEKESLLNDISFLKTQNYQNSLKEMLLKLRPEAGNESSITFEINYTEMLKCWSEQKYLESTEYINNLLRLNLKKLEDINYII